MNSFHYSIFCCGFLAFWLSFLQVFGYANGMLFRNYGAFVWDFAFNYFALIIDTNKECLTLRIY